MRVFATKIAIPTFLLDVTVKSKIRAYQFVEEIVMAIY